MKLASKYSRGTSFPYQKFTVTIFQKVDLVLCHRGQDDLRAEMEYLKEASDYGKLAFRMVSRNRYFV